MSDCLQRFAELLDQLSWLAWGAGALALGLSVQVLVTLRSLGLFLDARTQQIEHLMEIHDSPAVRRWVETRRAERRADDDVIEAEFEIKGAA